MTILPATIGQQAAGTKQTATSSSTIGAVVNGNVRAGDPVILGAYVVGADCTLAVDAGDGWVILDAGYDSVNGYGILLAACLSPKTGAWTGAGMTLPGNAAFTAQTVFYGITPSGAISDRSFGRLKPEQASGSRNGANGWFNDTASSTTLTIPRRDGPGYNQFLEFAVCGYTNDGSNPVETVSTAGSWVEDSDVGQNSPAHGLWMGRLTAPVAVATHGLPFEAGINLTISAACTNRAGVRCCIPIVGNLNATRFRNRYMSSRRMG